MNVVLLLSRDVHGVNTEKGAGHVREGDVNVDLKALVERRVNRQRRLAIYIYIYIYIYRKRYYARYYEYVCVRESEF